MVILLPDIQFFLYMAHDTFVQREESKYSALSSNVKNLIWFCIFQASVGDKVYRASKICTYETYGVLFTKPCIPHEQLQIHIGGEFAGKNQYGKCML